MFSKRHFLHSLYTIANQSKQLTIYNGVNYFLEEYLNLINNMSFHAIGCSLSNQLNISPMKPKYYTYYIPYFPLISLSSTHLECVQSMLSEKNCSEPIRNLNQFLVEWIFNVLSMEL
jgi:hypothetical protein